MPGPGQYIDISNPHHSSVCKSLLKFSADRGFAEAHGVKIGPFGSNTQRFSGNYFSTREGPGPGQYNPGDAKGSFEQDGSLMINSMKSTGTGAAAFPTEPFMGRKGVMSKSGAARFVEVEKNNPNVRILHKKQNQSADLGIYNVKSGDWGKQMRAPDFELYGGRKVGFDATSPRFNYN